MTTLTTKSIKDYLHLYIGCECHYRYVDWNTWNEGETLQPYILEKLRSDLSFEVKPILRNLSDMTEEEAKELCQYDKLCAEYGDDVTIMKDLSLGDVLTGLTIAYKHKIEDQIIPKIWKLSFAALNAHDFRWLLSRGFDLYNLIPEGLAIDKQTLKQ